MLHRPTRSSAAPRAWRRRLAGALALALMLPLGLAAYGWSEAHREAVVVRYRLGAPGLACAAGPLRLVEIGDLHLPGGETARLTRLVAAANALHPDLVLFVGDVFRGDGPPSDQAAAARLAPLAGLRARDGVFAVLGNNDWHDGAPRVRAALAAAHVAVLGNDAAVTPRAAVLGIEELTSNTANPLLAEERLAAALARAHRPRPPVTLWLAHNPVMFDRVVGLRGTMLTGHTHGGQILPRLTVPLMRWIDHAAPALAGQFGWSSGAYLRGLYRRGAARMIVTSGVGTSTLPLRLDVPPELVAIDLTGCPGPTDG